METKMTQDQIRVLNEVRFSPIRLTVNWYETPSIKDAFLALEKSGHIKIETRRWYLTEKGRGSLGDQP